MLKIFNSMQHFKNINKEADITLKAFDNKSRQNSDLLDFISNTALPLFKEGKIEAICALQEAFAFEGEKEFHIEIAEAYVKLLAENTVKGLIYISENCRNSMYGYFDFKGNDWKNTDMSRKRFEHLSCEQYIAVLKLGTFHSDGYCRQRCIEELAAYSGTLPFLVLRMNDWVKKIRNRAYVLALRQLERCDIYELLYSIPMLDKLRGSGRRDGEYLQKFEELFAQGIIKKMPELELCEVHTYEAAIKNAVYRFINKNRLLSNEAMETLLDCEKESYGKRLITLGIFKHYDCSFAQIQKYLENKSAVVRYESLVYWYYTKAKEPWEGLERLLMDKTKRIRLEAAYILKKHEVLEPIEYYRGKLKEDVTAAALYGIGEQGKQEDISLLEPYLEYSDERLARAALSSYLSLAGEEGADICWKYLTGEQASLRKTAYLAAKRHNIHYGPKRLYDEILKSKNEMAKNYLIKLIGIEPSTWERLPYLLRLWGSSSQAAEQNMQAVYAAISKRSMWAKVTRENAEEIKQALADIEYSVKYKDEYNQIKKQILFELKHVTV